jgi:hypothetical protein
MSFKHPASRHIRKGGIKTALTPNLLRQAVPALIKVLTKSVRTAMAFAGTIVITHGLQLVLVCCCEALGSNPERNSHLCR